MSNNKSTMMLIISSIVFLCLFSNAYSMTPPCESDSYMTTCNNTTGVVTIDYYLNNKYQCNDTLDQTYIGNCPADSGYMEIIDMSSIDRFNYIIQFILYFAVALMLVWIFIQGIGIINS